MALLSAALSIDAFAVSVSCTVRGIKMPVRSKIMICSVSFIITVIAVALGSVLFRILPPEAGTVLGGAMLIALGIYTAAGALIEEKRGSAASPDSETPLGRTAEIIRDPAACDGDGSRSVDLGEAVYIGVALSTDSFSVGIGAASGTGAVFIPLMCAAFQITLLFTGEFVGRIAFGHREIRQLWLSLLSAAVLMIAGILRLVF